MYKLKELLTLSQDEINAIPRKKYFPCEFMLNVIVKTTTTSSYIGPNGLVAIDWTLAEILSTVVYAMMAYDEEIEFEEQDFNNYNIMIESGLTEAFAEDSSYALFKRFFNNQLEKLEKENSLEFMTAGLVNNLGDIVSTFNENVLPKIKEMDDLPQKLEALIDLIEKKDILTKFLA